MTPRPPRPRPLNRHWKILLQDDRSIVRYRSPDDLTQCGFVFQVIDLDHATREFRVTETLISFERLNQILDETEAVIDGLRDRDPERAS